MLKNPNNDKRIKIKIDSIHPSCTHLGLYDNNGYVGELGLVQSFDIKCEIGKFNTITLTCLIEDIDINIPDTNAKIEAKYLPSWKLIKRKFKNIFKKLNPLGKITNSTKEFDKSLSNPKSKIYI